MMFKHALNVMDWDKPSKDNKSLQDLYSSFKRHANNVVGKERFLNQNVIYVKEIKLFQVRKKSTFILKREFRIIIK